MRRNSRTPCTVPSSPPRPCSALKTTSGLGESAATSPSRSRVTSIDQASKPSSSSAVVTSRPETSETSRSADQPPMRTATRLRAPDTLDLPLQHDAARLEDAGAHLLAEAFEI